jgi:tripartite-type tricarboxylate transporter receptor subunit TctC
VPFDPLKDHQTISLVVNYANVLCVNPELPIRTLKELIDYARANPEKVTYGSAGVGGSNHLAGELLAKMSGTKMVHVPYKGNNPAMMDVIGGKITMMFDITNTAASLIKAGKVRPIAVTSNRRNGALRQILADAAFVERLQGLGLDPESSSPEEFQALIRRDFEFWGKVVRDANVPRE